MQGHPAPTWQGKTNRDLGDYAVQSNEHSLACEADKKTLRFIYGVDDG